MLHRINKNQKLFTMKLKFICILLLAFSVGSYAQKAKAPAKKATTTKKTATPKTADPDGIFAVMETNKGRIVINLEYQKTPITVANFISLAEGTNNAVSAKYKGKQFYTGLKFHRVIPDFMIQGGDPLGTGAGDPGYKFKDEFNPDLRHNSGGILSMANSGPATNGSQFFITHKETPWLDNKHTVFGKVTSGMDVVNAIVQGDMIIEVKIVRKGAEAKRFDAAKIFNDYFTNKDADAKKEADAMEAKRKEADAKIAPVKAAKFAEFANLRAKATKSESGLEYVITKGNGAKPTGNVYVEYSGYFEDGKLFASSSESINKMYGMYDQNAAKHNAYQPFPFDVTSQSGLVPGFLEGIKLLSFGDKATFFIPANLGYGENGRAPIIGPNTNLVFEVQLFESLPTKQ
jgi:peptidyl-prolyl cis-trans isomerase A (cyclophilin A)